MIIISGVITAITNMVAMPSSAASMRSSESVYYEEDNTTVGMVMLVLSVLVRAYTASPHTGPYGPATVADEAGDIDDKVMILKLFVFQRW